jgi:hypothetical protein
MIVKGVLFHGVGEHAAPLEVAGGESSKVTGTTTQILEGNRDCLESGFGGGLSGASVRSSVEQSCGSMGED